jgi:hypothetical protein
LKSNPNTIKMKFKVLFSVLFLFGLLTDAQVVVNLGVLSGSGSSNVLLSTSTTTNRYSRTMSLYTASEIITAGGGPGTITQLAWDKSGPGEYTTNDAYIKIYLKHVGTDSTWSTAPVPVWDSVVIGATQVFTSNTYSLPIGVGWAQVPFTTPFVWNGMDNIVVMVEWDRSSAPSGAINWGRSTTTSANATRVGPTSLAALIMLVNNNRPLVQLHITLGGITITNVSVQTQGSVPAVIDNFGGTLQLEASVLPTIANQAVTWSIVPGTGTASISSSGLVTAQSNGTVWAKAVSDADPAIMDSLMITMSNQSAVISIVVATQGGVSAAISTDGGSLQVQATILPSGATQTVNWSIVDGTATANISNSGLVTAAQSNGTVWAKAVSTQDPSKMDSLLITISNQVVPITSIGVSLQSGAPIINTNGGTLQLVSTILPSGANQNVTWSVVNVSGNASINSSGLLTAIANGIVWAKAVSVQDPTKMDSLQITISNQTIGLEENTELGFLIYPNPVHSDFITLELSVNLSFSGKVVLIYDAKGRLVFQEELLARKQLLNIQSLAAGQYFLVLENGDQPMVKSFIKER